MILFFVVGIVGCKSNVLNEKEIASIRFVCVDLCKTMPNAPFSEKILTYENVDEIRIFQRSISKAVKMKGELDYGVMFLMSVSFDDGTQKKFVLIVADEDRRTALLVDTADRGSTSVADTTRKRMDYIGNLFITSLYSNCASVIANFEYTSSSSRFK